MIIHGDSLYELKTLGNDSVDVVITDPPYGYSFMGKDWDKAVPNVKIWRECLRVLKPGAFCLVMSAPRSDVQQAMTERLISAGFRLDFTPIYWTYASGFPKAGNIGKLVDKRLGATGEIIGQGKAGAGMNKLKGFGRNTTKGGEATTEWDIRSVASDEARALDGSYAGFQPKPAVEVVIVAMKPLSEKTYVDQALANGKGISWLDDGRIPFEKSGNSASNPAIRHSHGLIRKQTADSRPTSYTVRDKDSVYSPQAGRFPANLLVSDDVLNGHSRFFDLEKWYESALKKFPTFPFLIVPKAAKSEKNKGLDEFEDIQAAGLPMRSAGGERGGTGGDGSKTDRLTTMKNHHPTVKPLKLMSYLITLFSRPGDTVLDPFVGSGTTVIAAHQLGREGIGIERESEYVEIARARLKHQEEQLQQQSLL